MSVKIVVPEMGESVVDARVRRWLKQAGDAVVVGEPLVELETDKVDVEVSASKSGVLASIAHPEGADVKIGDTLGTIDESAAGTAPAKPAAQAPAAKAPTPAAQPSGVAATPSAPREARAPDGPPANGESGRPAGWRPGRPGAWRPVGATCPSRP